MTEKEKFVKDYLGLPEPKNPHDVCKVANRKRKLESIFNYYKGLENECIRFKY
tara:strand:- start:277 stop:435 length:159 start_codon:yes stop_codon:yes gene_type:complete